MSRAVLLTVAVLSLGFAPAPFLKPPMGADLKALQGAWVPLGCCLDGRVGLLAPNREVTYCGNRVVDASPRRISMWGKAALDTSRNPRRIVLDFGEQGRALCLYRIEDTLTLCSFTNQELAGQHYPPDFTPMPGVFVETYKRKKP